MLELAASKAADLVAFGPVQVETFCTYDRLPNGSFTGLQRTATFLSPYSPSPSPSPSPYQPYPSPYERKP